MYAHTTALISTGGGGGGPVYDPVINTVLNADGNYNLPAGLLAYITISNAAGLANLAIGITPGGNELGEEAIAAGQSAVFSIGERFTAATLIYFTGIDSATNISFYKF